VAIRKVLIDPLLILVITVALAWAYAPVVHHEPILYDDPVYVTANPHVLGGLSLASMRWALTASDAANWHPLTWWSHMLDVSLFGDQAGAHFGMSVALHIADAWLLWLALRRLTGSAWPSAIVACVWAIHPLQVQSVAWLSERKSTLSTLFWFGALAVYAPVVSRPTLRGWLALALLTVAALMAKPMAVTLPCTLLLLDWWPLGRWRAGQRLRCVIEKLPLFALVAAASVLTWRAQQDAGAVSELEAVSLAERIARAAVATVTLFGKTIVPTGLCYFHPVRPISLLEEAAAVALLLAITAAAWWLRARRPFVLFGWLWFLGTLFPVSGLMAQGEQLWADRYAYVPMVGLLVAVTWSARDLLYARPALRPAVLGAVSAAVFGMVLLTRAQVDTWEDSYMLFTHALAVHPDSYVAHRDLGKVFLIRGRIGDALAQFNAGLAVAPSDPGLRQVAAEAHVTLGLDAERHGSLDESEAHYRQAIDFMPTMAIAHFNLGLLLMRAERFDDAFDELQAAVADDPQNSHARAALGHLLLMVNRTADARAQLERAVALDPRLAPAHLDLGEALAAGGNLAAARATYQALLDWAPQPEREEAARRLSELQTIP
jgi:tetratricopeptide (TPR) repeat protein